MLVGDAITQDPRLLDSIEENITGKVRVARGNRDLGHFRQFWAEWRVHWL